MMKAAVYSTGASGGVALTQVPKPTLTGNKYNPHKGNSAKIMILALLSIFVSVLGICMRILRVFLKFIPPPFGYYADRKAVLCKVHAVGVNPVDAKKLYGDKLPHAFYPLIEWFIGKY
jgi:hypothetical protein